MKNQFCKVFDFLRQQVLVTKEFEDQDETFKMNQTTSKDGLEFTMGLGFHSEKERDDAFEDYNADNAKKFIDILNKDIFSNQKSKK